MAAARVRVPTLEPPESRPLAVLDQELFRLRARLRLQRSVAMVPRAVLAGAILLCCTLVAQALAGWPLSVATGSSIGALAALGLFGAGARRRPSLDETARLADYRLGLRQRLGTAIELLNAGSSGLLVESQLRDATAAAQGVSPSQAFPFRWAWREVALSGVAVASALAFVLWATSPADSGYPLLALNTRGQPGGDMDDLLQAERVASPGDLSAAREYEQGSVVSEAPEAMATTPLNPGAITPPQQQGERGLSRAERADEQLRGQQDPAITQRQEALREVAQALRQNQTTRAAGDSLSREDYQKAADQLRQAADSLRRLSPGERNRLAQQLREAGRQIQDRDPQLASQLDRAASALEQYRDQEAREALRGAAQQIQQTGQQLQAQRDLKDRREAMQRGDAQQARLGQQLDGRPQTPGSQQGQQGSGQQVAPRAREGGRDEGGQGSDGAPTGIETEGGARSQGTGAGPGIGSGEGQALNPDALPHRLNVEGRRVLVEADVGEGVSQWRSASPDSLPGFGQPAAAAVPVLPASTAAVTGGADLNLVPFDLLRAVRQYFTPPQPPARSSDAASGQQATSSEASTGGPGSTSAVGQRVPGTSGAP